MRSTAPVAALTISLTSVATTAQPSACDWRAIGSPDGSSSIYVQATAVFDEGSGPALFAMGNLSQVGGVQGVGRLDESGWSAVGVAAITTIHDALVWDDTLVIGGNFNWMDSAQVRKVARWDGQAWSGFGAGFDDNVHALAVYDDGTGEALYAAGEFRNSGDTEIRNIARWNGQAWESVGGGTNFGIRVLGVYDLGDGQALYAGGQFTEAGGQPALHFAKWDGTSWEALGEGVPDRGYVMEAFDDGRGMALYTGRNTLSRWDGSAWSTVPGLEFTSAVTHFAPIASLRAFDDGSGSQLYIGGSFTRVNSVIANSIVRWDGRDWESLGNGITGPDQTRTVSSLRVHDLGDGPALYVGGRFLRSGGLSSENLARWTNWSQSCPSDLTADCRVDFTDVMAFLVAYSLGDPAADFNSDDQIGFFDVTAFLGSFNAGCP